MKNNMLPQLLVAVVVAVVVLASTTSAQPGPTVRHFKVAPDTVELNDRVGYEAAVFGDWIVAGAPALSEPGQVHIYQRDQHEGTLTFHTTLEDEDNLSADDFGVAVALGKPQHRRVTLLVAAPEIDRGSNSHHGAVYVYRYEERDDTWSLDTRLMLDLPDEVGASGRIGDSVAIFRDTIAVGSMSSHSSQGAVYIWEYNPTGKAWEFKQNVTRPGGGVTSQEFGRSVSLHGNVLVVGAPGDDSIAANAGIAYVYRRSSGAAGAWEHWDTLTSSNVRSTALFGTDVVAESGLIVVSARSYDVPTAGPDIPDVGLVDIFRENTLTDQWNYLGSVAPPDPAPSQHFGSSLALGRDSLTDDMYLYVGARDYQANLNNEGRIHTYRRLNTTLSFVYQESLTPDDLDANDYFAWFSAAGDGTMFAAGAQQANSPAATGSGAVYVFGMNACLDNQADNGVNVCAACPAGQSSVLGTPCSCPHNQYDDGGVCTDCPANSFDSYPAAKSVAGCRCNPGYYLDLTSGECVQCVGADESESPIGATSASECIACPVGTYSSGDGKCPSCDTLTHDDDPVVGCELPDAPPTQLFGVDLVWWIVGGVGAVVAVGAIVLFVPKPGVGRGRVPQPTKGQSKPVPAELSAYPAFTAGDSTGATLSPPTPGAAAAAGVRGPRQAHQSGNARRAGGASRSPTRAKTSGAGSSSGKRSLTAGRSNLPAGSSGGRSRGGRSGGGRSGGSRGGSRGGGGGGKGSRSRSPAGRGPRSRSPRR